MTTGKLVVPEFHSREEEAAFWDNLDTADYMPDDDQWFTFEWTEREDRCRRCGGGMDARPMDLYVAGGRVVLRQVPLYICRTPGCGNTQLPSAIGELVRRMEALVEETLSSVGRVSYPPPAAYAVSRTSPAVPAAAAVRDEQTAYDADED